METLEYGTQAYKSEAYPFKRNRPSDKSTTLALSFDFLVSLKVIAFSSEYRNF